MNRSAARAGARAGSAAQPTPSVSLAIERIVIDGPAMTPLQTHRLQVSIERELSRLFRTAPDLPPPGAMARLRAPSLRGDASADPLRFGVEIARSLHAALGTRE